MIFFNEIDFKRNYNSDFQHQFVGFILYLLSLV